MFGAFGKAGSSNSIAFVSKVMFGSNSTQKNDFLNFSKYNILLQETYCTSSERNKKKCFKLVIYSCQITMTELNFQSLGC
jgi:hypothetical protein